MSSSEGSNVSTLHPIERALLKELGRYSEPVTIESLAGSSGLALDQARRGVEWLRFKNLVSVQEDSVSMIELGSNGLESKSGVALPERRLVGAIQDGKKTIGEVLASRALKGDEVSAAMSNAKDNRWILVEGKELRLNSAVDYSALSPEERLIQKFKDRNAISIPESELDEAEKAGLQRLSRRPDYVSKKTNKRPQIMLTGAGRALLAEVSSGGGAMQATERRLTPEMITSGKWKEARFDAIDVEAPAPTVFPGRRHPLVDIIEEVKEIFVGLGFSEIDGPLVQSGFWNFDALYTPQDHPAREMQDTFYVSGQRQAIPADRDQVSKISRVHTNGWGRGWRREEAERVVLRTHTTPVTLQHLAATRQDSARFFLVGRVFRNEKVSYKHLVEFHQVEGVATYQKASLRDLMGLQKEFYAKMGVRKVKFWPTFFPYTEPSLQSMVYNERLGKWVELFGMGIFRPEVTESLGIKNPVLAWGGGLERIAMLRFGLDDVRELYSNRLSWLRSVPRCQL